jgi:hypothetical protein
LLTEEDFRDFVFANPVRPPTAMPPDFFRARWWRARWPASARAEDVAIDE